MCMRQTAALPSDSASMAPVERSALISLIMEAPAAIAGKAIAAADKRLGMRGHYRPLTPALSVRPGATRNRALRRRCGRRGVGTGVGTEGSAGGRSRRLGRTRRPALHDVLDLLAIE